MTSFDSQGTRRPVGRGKKVLAAVRAAALEELVERGYAAFSIENVARRAGVHKTTVYRRWETREQLVADALGEHIAVEVPMPDTGTIEADLLEMGRALVNLLNSLAGQAIIAALLSDAVRVPEIARIRQRVFRGRLERAEPVIIRAIERGELPEDVIPERVIMALAAPIYFRVLVSGEDIDERAADEAARIALAAAQAGALSRPA